MSAIPPCGSPLTFRSAAHLYARKSRVEPTPNGGGTPWIITWFNCAPSHFRRATEGSRVLRKGRGVKRGRETLVSLPLLPPPPGGGGCPGWGFELVIFCHKKFTPHRWKTMTFRSTIFLSDRIGETQHFEGYSDKPPQKGDARRKYPRAAGSGTDDYIFRRRNADAAAQSPDRPSRTQISAT